MKNVFLATLFALGLITTSVTFAAEEIVTEEVVETTEEVIETTEETVSEEEFTEETVIEEEVVETVE